MMLLYLPFGWEIVAQDAEPDVSAVLVLRQVQKSPVFRRRLGINIYC